MICLLASRTAPVSERSGYTTPLVDSTQLKALTYLGASQSPIAPQERSIEDGPVETPHASTTVSAALTYAPAPPRIIGLVSDHRTAVLSRSNPRLVDPAFYGRFIADRGLDEGEYREAVGALAGLMPFEEAQKKYDAVVGAGAQHSLLHPVPGRRLTYHPLPYLLGGPIPDTSSLCDLVRLGLDLVATNDILGTQRVRNRLLVLEGYLGALFEIEVGAELVRAKLRPTRSEGTPDWLIQLDGVTVGVECRYQEAMLPIAIAPRLMALLFSRDFGTFRIHFKPGAGGVDTVDTIMASLDADVEELLSGRAVSCCRPWYDIQYDPGTLGRAVQIHFGAPGDKYTATLARKAEGWVREKHKRLTRAGRATPCLVALDFRSLVGGLPKAGGPAASMPYYQQQMKQLGWGDQRDGLIEGVRQFLTTETIISGALTWWRRFEFEITDMERLWRPWEVVLMTKDATHRIERPADLAAACRLALVK
jgi:hypothetical protein